MAYLLYGANGSGSSIVEAALLEIGAEYAVQTVDAANDAHRGEAYAAVNPHRKMPTLISPQGETLTESAAIVLTLAERHPEAALLPAIGTSERARALRWLMFAATELYPIIEIVDHPERFVADESTKDGTRRVALQRWRQRWTTVESQLGEGPYLGGATFCITDVYLAALSRWDLEPQWRAANIPKVERLARAVSERSALRALWPRHFPKG